MTEESITEVAQIRAIIDERIEWANLQLGGIMDEKNNNNNRNTPDEKNINNKQTGKVVVDASAIVHAPSGPTEAEKAAEKDKRSPAEKLKDDGFLRQLQSGSVPFASITEGTVYVMEYGDPNRHGHFDAIFFKDVATRDKAQEFAQAHKFHVTTSEKPAAKK